MLACVHVHMCVCVCVCLYVFKCNRMHEKHPQKLSGSIQAVANALRLQIKNNRLEDDYF